MRTEASSILGSGNLVLKLGIHSNEKWCVQKTGAWLLFGSYNVVSLADARKKRKLTQDWDAFANFKTLVEK